MTTRGTSMVVAGLVGVLGGACGPRPGEPAPPRFVLEGSLGQLMNLGYDEARIRYVPPTEGRNDGSLSLDFVRTRPLGDSTLPDGGMVMAGASEDFVLQLGYELQGDTPPDNQRIDLTFLDANGLPRTTLARNVLNDPRRSFPPLRVGSLFFDRAPNNETMNTVNGEFNLTFENGIEVASGRTVFGRFSAKVIPP
ncbi:MAG: hypothetical protein MUC96_17645 [Myxococcaceae bacterium]|nr:hypothetical protein [Myxococcaceae bacterium]